MTTKEKIYRLTETLSHISGEAFRLDYNSAYGGYTLYIAKNGESGHFDSKLGINMYDRRSCKEMYAYLCGILDGWRAKELKQYTNN